MKTIMRGVLLFGMLGGMLLSCGGNGNKKEKKVEKTQVEKKVYKIGISQIIDHPALNSAKQGFKDALIKSGIESEFDDRTANGEIPTQTLIMQQFSADKKDLVYTITTPTSQAAKNQIKDIPIVIAAVTDPKGAGLEGVENITGTSGAAPINENLELMKQVFPKVKKIGIIYNSSEQNSVSELNNLKKLAPEKGFQILEKAITNGTELVAAANIISKQVDIYYAIQDNTISSYFPTLLDILNNAGIPVFATSDVYSDRGGLISQGTTDYDLGYRAGEIAVEILKNGKKPANIPIETIKNLKIEINRKNMEMLKIKIPEEILKKAVFTEDKNKK
ncbi:ABC transporter substrate-binding protein [Leptotrichia sp. OH3620_COT-345]|uniref:ABC transporter substrate-binding protein n=1 Tax=Leptotrichia sp. OH3620_COT-345 TaxID=2491048 RepID=UPI000F65318A|nr:ABC transporter substrate-binding protein [Leptotrichia sp. OH3620_COT-345]RRD41006.1 ABC transporter substrate-binding protein [Leptotrichia sp. OH3620_COT-345]